MKQVIIKGARLTYPQFEAIPPLNDMPAKFSVSGRLTPTEEGRRFFAEAQRCLQEHFDEDGGWREVGAEMLLLREGY